MKVSKNKVERAVLASQIVGNDHSLMEIKIQLKIHTAVMSLTPKYVFLMKIPRAIMATVNISDL